MATIVTDISINQNWNARKGVSNPVTFTFTSAGSAFDISGYTFSIQIRKFGSTTNLVNLTQGSGITNNGAAGTLQALVSAANLSSMLEDDYYWQMTVVHPDTLTYIWYQGTFNLFAEISTEGYTSGITTTLDLNGTSVTSAITLSGATSVSIQTVTSAATVTALSTNDYVDITAQAVGLTLANPSGTPSNFAMIVYRIEDDGNAQTIAVGSQFRRIAIDIPTTTVAGKITWIVVSWHPRDSKWDVVNVIQQT
jgi:hypothetical protein